MTPDQITIVERTLEQARSRLELLARDFYDRLFAAEPDVRRCSRPTRTSNAGSSLISWR
jgi:hypothetical protein